MRYLIFSYLFLVFKVHCVFYVYSTYASTWTGPFQALGSTAQHCDNQHCDNQVLSSAH